MDDAKKVVRAVIADAIFRGAGLKIGELIRTEIRDVAFGGDVVGRDEEPVIFVPFTVDGDEVEVEITEVRKRYARGRLVRVIVPSHYRVTPLCRY